MKSFIYYLGCFLIGQVIAHVLCRFTTDIWVMFFGGLPIVFLAIWLWSEIHERYVN